MKGSQFMTVETILAIVMGLTYSIIASKILDGKEISLVKKILLYIGGLILSALLYILIMVMLKATPAIINNLSSTLQQMAIENQ